MIKLTKEQIEFLKNFDIPVDNALNGAGLGKSECIQIMKNSNYQIVYGVSPYKREGHTLRWRSWHCAQCNTHNRIFQSRFENEGYVYVAATKLGGLIKVGVCNDFHKREQTLNEQIYGGYDDWKIYKTPKYCPYDAGKIEHLVQLELRDYGVKSDDFVDFRMQRSYELFDFPASKAYSLVLNTANQHGF